MSIVYLKDFYNNKRPEKTSEHIIYNCGVFSVKYETLPDMPPENSFGLYHWKSSHNTVNAYFFKNDELLFTKPFKCSPSIVIHGDGITENGTFFTFNDRTKAMSIFNMKNELIKVESLGADCFVELKRVSDKYAIAVTEEICTYDPFTSLINLDILFGIEQSVINRPYSNSREHVPLTKDQGNKLSLYPMIATNEGLIVLNKFDVNVNYQFTRENLVLYDDIFNKKIHFYENVKNVDVLSVLGFSKNKKNEINNKVCNDSTNSVSLSMENLNDEQKNDMLKKINDAYDEFENDNKNIQRTFAMIKPDAMEKNYKNNILYAIDQNGFDIIDSLEITFNSDMVDEFYAEHVGKSFYPKLKEFMMSGQSCLLILENDDAVRSWRKLIGPTYVSNAKNIAPYTLRAIYGDNNDDSKNACHGSDSIESAKREINFFNKIKENTNNYTNDLPKLHRYENLL